MKAAPGTGPAYTPRRHPAVIVEHLRFEVVEGPDTVDPMAINEVLGLLARWAVRTQMAPDKAAPTPNLANSGLGEQA